MGNINVAVTGYQGTGSGAVLDLLKEYEGIEVVPTIGRTYEHLPFYYKGGLFDLCTALTVARNPISTDVAINRFLESMMSLYKNRYIWMGNYKEICGEDFLRLNDSFVEKICSPFNTLNHSHYVRTKFSLIRLLLQCLAKLVYGKPIVQPGIKTVVDNKSSYISLVSTDALFEAAREYTKGYLDLVSKGCDASIRVFDHLLLPQHIDVYNECFTEDLKIIVLNRDIRDMYLINKYVYTQSKYGRFATMLLKKRVPYFPCTPKAFSEMWDKLIIPSFNNPNCLNLEFEDLIYNYEDTVRIIEDFIGIDSSAHVRKGRFFDPTRSINNTQLFLCSDDWAKEVSSFDEKWCYGYPFQRVPEKKLMMH